MNDNMPPVNIPEGDWLDRDHYVEQYARAYAAEVQRTADRWWDEHNKVVAVNKELRAEIERLKGELDYSSEHGKYCWVPPGLR